MHSTGATLANVNEGVLLSLRLRTVSLEDQLASVNRALRINEAADRLVERLTRQIDLLAERRQALITGAVTGELDIARTIVEEAS
jgi:type I restriction enzyme S subunit